MARKARWRRHDLAASWQVIAMVAVASIALGAGVALALTTMGSPAALSQASGDQAVAIESLSINDARTVTLAVAGAPAPDVLAPRSGMVTASSCSADLELHSGAQLMSIDGVGVMLLASKEPLWRDLHVGDRGSDVAGLNGALSALLGTDPDGDTVTSGTVSAFDDALGAAGIGSPRDGTIHADAVAWLAGEGLHVATCTAQVGQQVSAGEPVATLPDTAISAKAQELPTGVIAGKRVLRVDGIDIGINEQGEVQDPSALSATPSFARAMAESGSHTIQASWLLETPATVGAVPVSAVGLNAGGQPCIVLHTKDGDKPANATVLGSMLGKAYVQSDGSVPQGEVLLDPSASGSCS